MRKTKIIATIGPATAKKRVIRALIAAGCNVFRLNFSHGTHAEHSRTIKLIRQIAKELRRPIALLADIQGPKIRTGLLKNKTVELQRGSTIVLTTKKILGDENKVTVDWPTLPSVVKKGMTVLLAEGMLKLKVLTKSKTEVRCKILYGGTLGEHKGVNILGVELRSVLTSKDKKDIRFAVGQGLKMFALSFIRTGAEVARIKKFIARFQKRFVVIAKIEKPEAVHNLKDILREVNGVMVARGDLGVEGKLEKIPIWQKRIIREANNSVRFVVTATQMLESMINSPRPTRAEVTDVANAIFDGTDAVMLSGETAVGKYPVQTVRMMRNVIRAAERNNVIRYYLDMFSKKDVSLAFSIAHAAIYAVREAEAKAIIVFTLSGRSAALLSKRKPEVPIFALTPNEDAYNGMSILWGVYPRMTTLGKNIDTIIDKGVSEIRKERHLRKGDRVVVVYGLAEKRGGTDRMRIMTIE